ncbi:MAG TPA: FAD-linked oxidase C-terminal domain-containing protein [Actinocrinis sp.]|uniref:FAD-binding oxidoreductase n=1 Tax=Actinocrinis sp. TaxID=1920516 RepID=UPI002DDCE39C|nr:FAD-linked oxidase C-terminal domain-containing protein [Actinocrinis sp.]HEV2343723.1 FAD-linked oxidase C-terminal domain-containing protein [Actinocrinis sp.]
MITDDLVNELQAGRVVTDPDQMSAYCNDEHSYVTPGQPCAVVVARERDDVVAALRWATRNRVPVIPRGAGTGIVGGTAAIDGCLVLSVAKMTAIRELSAQDEIAVVEPGVINAELDKQARKHGLMYAPDPSSYETCTIGGNIATNAGGLRCVKYGVTRESVLGLEAVLADGTVIRTGRRTIKGVVGYDLTSLLVGSEGTLAVVTEATLRLRPAPKQPPVTVAAEFATVRQAAEAVFAIVRSAVGPSLLELIDRTTLKALDDWRNIGLDPATGAMLLAQADGSDAAAAAAVMAECCEAGGASVVAVSEDEAEAAELLNVRRAAFNAIERLGSCLIEDVCVPRSQLPEMFDAVAGIAEKHGVTVPTVAHAGDGNLHPVFVFDRTLPRIPDEIWAAAEEVFRAALALGGTLTGEHGVGTLKRHWLGEELGEQTLAANLAIKRALDPLGILNPGKAI